MQHNGFKCEFFTELKNSRDVSLKYTVLFRFFLKFSQYINMLLMLSFFHFWTNFVPIDRTLVVAKLGWKHAHRLCSPTSTTCFSNTLKRSNMNIIRISLTRNGCNESPILSTNWTSSTITTSASRKRVLYWVLRGQLSQFPWFEKTFYKNSFCWTFLFQNCHRFIVILKI